MKMIYFSPMANNINEEVKKAMIAEDLCHREEEFTKLLQRVRGKLTEVVKAGSEYSVVIINGSGTAALESIIGSLDKEKCKLLILENGHYGQRLYHISGRYGFKSTEVMVFDKVFKMNDVEDLLKNEEITHVAMVHHETSTGTLNPLTMVGRLCKQYNKKLIVDAISSIAVHDIDVIRDNISFLAGSSNKGIGGPEGISFVVGKKAEIAEMIGRSPYLSLRENMEKQNEGQTLFTPAVRIYQGFDKALDLLREEGLEERQKRFAEIAFTLRAGMKELGFELMTQSPSNVSSLYSIGKHDFKSLHKTLKTEGYVIYTGIDDKTFRLCTFGELTVNDIKNFLEVLKNKMIKGI